MRGTFVKLGAGSSQRNRLSWLRLVAVLVQSYHTRVRKLSPMQTFWLVRYINNAVGAMDAIARVGYRCEISLKGFFCQSILYCNSAEQSLESSGLDALAAL